MINYGELYYDHYIKFLGQPAGRELFVHNEHMPSIQVLHYQNVFDDCIVYATLGLSQYNDIIGNHLEVSMAVDEGFDRAGYILANTLYYAIANRMQLGRGVAISGIENVDPSFTEQYDKAAVYLTDPFAFPAEYSTLSTGNPEKEGRMLSAIFITQSEYDYFSEHGTELFEDLLESKDVDPFHISRMSIV